MESVYVLSNRSWFYRYSLLAFSIAVLGLSISSDFDVSVKSLVFVQLDARFFPLVKTGIFVVLLYLLMTYVFVCLAEHQQAKVEGRKAHDSLYRQSIFVGMLNAAEVLVPLCVGFVALSLFVARWRGLF